MTLIYKADPVVPGSTHAFVIGVGDYPHAKADLGTNEALRYVRDLPSAADGAKLMCDWLLVNRDKLEAPLGSIEVLISDVPGEVGRYIPRDPRLLLPIARADGTTIPPAGNAWLGRIYQDPGSTAFFYACGHGASLGTQPTLFHSDLNLNRGGDAWAHLNIGSMALAFRQMQELAAAFFFIDACGEYVPSFPSLVRDSGFISPDLVRPTDRDKVWLLAAASAGLLAFPGRTTDAVERDPEYEAAIDDGNPVKIGRFTQTVLKGLNGACAHWDGQAWSVDNKDLNTANLKTLHRVYFPSWRDKPFEPSDVLSINSRVSIIRHDAVRLPVLVLTDPAQRHRRLRSQARPRWVRWAAVGRQSTTARSEPVANACERRRERFVLCARLG